MNERRSDFILSLSSNNVQIILLHFRFEHRCVHPIQKGVVSGGSNLLTLFELKESNDLKLVFETELYEYGNLRQVVL